MNQNQRKKFSRHKIPMKIKREIAITLAMISHKDIWITKEKVYL